MLSAMEALQFTACAASAAWVFLALQQKTKIAAVFRVKYLHF